MSLLPPKVGDTVYIVRINNAARGRTPEQLKPFPAKVSSVGRKYFKVSDAEYSGQQIEFRLDTWAQNAGGYSPDYQAYMSEQQILDEQEAKELRKSIVFTFNWTGNGDELSLETLRQIRALIDADKNKKSNRLQEMQKMAKESVISSLSRGCGNSGCNRSESSVTCLRGNARGC